jgi:hypothetical protein
VTLRRPPPLGRLLWLQLGEAASLSPRPARPRSRSPCQGRPPHGTSGARSNSGCRGPGDGGLCVSWLDHPVDHPDDPTEPISIRLDRRGTQREQARSDWSRPDRRRAPGYGSGGWGFESLAARRRCRSEAVKQGKLDRALLAMAVLHLCGCVPLGSQRPLIQGHRGGLLGVHPGVCTLAGTHRELHAMAPRTATQPAGTLLSNLTTTWYAHARGAACRCRASAGR